MPFLRFYTVMWNKEVKNIQICNQQVVRREYSNWSDVQKMELSFWKLALLKWRSQWTPSSFETFISWCEK